MEYSPKKLLDRAVLIAIVTIVCALFSSCGTPTGDSDEKEIISFQLTAFKNSSLADNVVGKISGRIITLSVTEQVNIKNLRPTIEYKGKSISPESEASKDFSKGSVKYIVTGEDDTIIEYSVSVLKSGTVNSKSITSFNFYEPSNSVLGHTVYGSIDSTSDSILLTVPFGTDTSALIPSVLHSGTSIKPGSDVSADFSSGSVIYTVTARDSSKKNYSVSVTIEPISSIKDSSSAAPISSNKDITSFNFYASENSTLSQDVYGLINSDSGSILLTVPYGTDISALIPSILHSGAAIVPVSDLSSDYSSGSVTYTVIAQDSSKKEYSVSVAIAPVSTSKIITSFNFNASNNPALSQNVVGLIEPNLDRISLTVPYGTDISALVPSIVHYGTAIMPGSEIPFNFSSGSVIYTVTAQDSSTRTFSVSVMIAPISSNKDITLFNFYTINNAALSKNVFGSIDSAANSISLTVPFGTDVSALVPSIMHSGASVLPDSDIIIDFSSGSVTYTVTARDSTIKNYSVSVTIAPISTDKDIASFDFNTSNNAGLNQYVMGSIDSTSRSVLLTVPFGTDTSALIPTIVHTGATISPGSNDSSDFSSGSVIYTVTAQDSSTKDYSVSVVAKPISSNKAIISFNFYASPNFALSQNVYGLIDSASGSISLTVPFDTDTSALMPTIVHSGAKISPSNNISADFSFPSVEYTVTALDSSTRDYSVSVTIAPISSSKEITSFNFYMSNNAALSQNVYGSIDSASDNILLTVPFGTDTSALVPSIKHSGSSISPSNNDSSNFSADSVTYTITAQDSSTKDYSVIVSQQ